MVPENLHQVLMVVEVLAPLERAYANKRKNMYYVYTSVQTYTSNTTSKLDGLMN